MVYTNTKLFFTSHENCFSNHTVTTIGGNDRGGDDGMHVNSCSGGRGVATKSRQEDRHSKHDGANRHITASNTEMVTSDPSSPPHLTDQKEEGLSPG